MSLHHISASLLSLDGVMLVASAADSLAPCIKASNNSGEFLINSCEFLDRKLDVSG